MNMIRISIVTVIGAVVPMMVNVVKATPNQVMVDTIPNYYTGNGGGEFTAYTTPGSFLGNYAPGAIVNQGFETFCMETGVEFSPGATYYYTLGNMTQPTTGGGQGSGLKLTAGVADLYYQFAKGTLAGFDYNDLSVGGGRQTDADLLQSAIWLLQGGQTFGSYPSGNNKFLTEAILLAGGINGTLADAEADYTGSTVQILQLWSNSDDTGAAQNQLVLVPDGGLTVSLLGGALIGLQVLRRKLSL